MRFASFHDQDIGPIKESMCKNATSSDRGRRANKFYMPLCFDVSFFGLADLYPFRQRPRDGHKGPHALLTMLYRSTDCLCCSGAPV
jgi:hypothetical protein